MEQDQAASFRAEAHRLGAFLLERAETRPDGSLFWTRAKTEGPAAALGPHLYTGHAGVALFFAALAPGSGDARFRDAARRILLPLRRQLRKLAEQPGDRPITLGAVTGLASFVYTFLRVGSWLGESELAEDACTVAGLITPARIAASGSADLLSGAAGVLLTLLLLEREAPPAWRDRLDSLASAVACGERLLGLQIAEGENTGGWPNFVQPPSSGFAHGASGVVLALLRLAERTGREDFRSAALAGLAFERPHFDPEIDNWWPVRGRRTPLQLNAWCNGAAGIALARLRLLDLESSPAIREDLELALASLARAPEAQLDSACCGHLGRAEILFEAGRRLGRAELSEAAARLAADTVAAARERSFRYRLDSFDGCCPGFFTGLSGIGYALLRLAGEARLPCVLTLE